MDLRRQADADKTALLAKEVAGLEEVLRRQRILREVRTLRRIASRPGERRKLAADLIPLRRFTPEGWIPSGDGGRDRRLAAEKEKARAVLDAAEENLRRGLEEKARAEEEKNRLEKTRVLAEVLKSSIGDREKLVERKTAVVLRPVLLTAAVLFLAAGAASFFLLPPAYAPAGLAAGAAIFVVAGAFSFPREVREDTRRFEEALASAGLRWRTGTGESWEGLGYEAILVSLDRAAERAARAEETFTNRRDAAAAESRVADLRSSFRKSDEEPPGGASGAGPGWTAPAPRTWRTMPSAWP